MLPKTQEIKKMQSSFVLIDSKTKEIRTDGENQNMLIFDSATLARRYLKKISDKHDRESTELVEVTLRINKVT